MTEKNNEDKEQRQMPVTAIAYPMHYDDDEISLIDLWLVLVRRKWIFWGVFMVIVIAALLYALLRSPTYAYNSALQVGQMMNEHGQIVSIESPASVLANLQNAIVPNALQKYAENNPAKATKIREGSVASKQQGDTDVLTLHSKGSTNNANLFKNLQNTILKSTIAEQTERIQSLKQYLQKRKQSLEQTIETLTNQREQTYKRLNQLIDSEQKAQDGSSQGTASALITMQSLGSLQAQLAPLNQQIQSARGELTTVDARLISFRPTHITLHPSRSIDKVNTGGALVLLIGVVLALFLGLIAAYVAEFFAVANSRQRDST